MRPFTTSTIKASTFACPLAVGVLLTAIGFHFQATAASPTNESAAETAGDSATAEEANLAFEIAVSIADANSSEVLDSHLILFDQNVVYDFALADPHVVTVIDTESKQITLLSRARQVKSVVSAESIVTTSARVRADARTRKLENQLGLAAKSKQSDDGFQIEFPGYHYTARTQSPAQAAHARQFAEFTEWVARLNLVRRLGPPPFARIKLGREIAAAGELPATITLHCKSDQVDRSFVSKYTYEGTLSNANRAKINQVIGMTQLYRDVPIAEFPE
jgi:hypothetical protein